MLPQLATFFFFNDTATTEIYTLSLHDALPICCCWSSPHARLSAGSTRRSEPARCAACTPRTSAHHSRLTLIAHGTTLSRMSVLAVVPDLYFATRIAATAKAAGVALELVSPQRVVAKLTEPGVSLVIVELQGRDALALIAELKRAAPAIPVVGFGPHVEAALLRDAKSAGADAVLPRSQLAGKLPSLLAHGLAAIARPG